MARPARRYDRRIEVWDYLVNNDGYGGSIAEPNVNLGTVWADIETIAQNKLTEYGLDTNLTAIRVFTRDGSHIDFEQNNLLLKKGSDEYQIYSVTPTNIDGIEIEILAQK